MHSIVQYYLDENTSENRLQWGLGKVFDWGKKIGHFFNFSKLGSGHTESIEWSKTRHFILPDDIRYETQWWNRTLKLDGKGPPLFYADSFLAAEQYTDEVCLGHIQKFRRFFEMSMKKTDRPEIYLEMFLKKMLTKKAQYEAEQAFKRHFGSGYSTYKIRANKEHVTNLMMGYTRKRNLLVPEWADNEKLWN